MLRKLLSATGGACVRQPRGGGREGGRAALGPVCSALLLCSARDVCLDWVAGGGPSSETLPGAITETGRLISLT